MRCRVDVAPLRAEPADDAEQVTQALLREPLDLEQAGEASGRFERGGLAACVRPVS